MFHLLILLTTLECVTSQDYVTYIKGTLPIIISAPHGGNLTPSSIPDRDAGCWDGSRCTWSHDCGQKDENNCKATTVKDHNTKELTMLLRDELFTIYGEYPHVIINELHRRKFDANRAKDEATFGVPVVEHTWEDFHTYINNSKAAAGSRPSFFIEIHGHSHQLQWAELGNLISGSALDSGNFAPENTSIRRLAASVGIPFEDLLRGSDSFGGILEQEGFEAVPSVSKPGPSGNPYFNGGYNTRVHGSRYGGLTDALQIESPSSFRADELRAQYAAALGRTIQRYMELHFGFVAKTHYGDDNAASQNAFSISVVVAAVALELCLF